MKAKDLKAHQMVVIEGFDEGEVAVTYRRSPAHSHYPLQFTVRFKLNEELEAL
jgi:tRNA splicing endonuclease